MEKYNDIDGEECKKINERYAENDAGIGYKLSNWFGYTKVVRVNDGEIMYRIPINLYLAKCFIPLSVVMYFVSFGYVVRKLQNYLF